MVLSLVSLHRDSRSFRRYLPERDVEVRREQISESGYRIEVFRPYSKTVSIEIIYMVDEAANEIWPTMIVVSPPNDRVRVTKEVLNEIFRANSINIVAGITHRKEPPGPYELELRDAEWNEHLHIMHPKSIMNPTERGGCTLLLDDSNSSILTLTTTTTTTTWR